MDILSGSAVKGVVASTKGRPGRGGFMHDRTGILRAPIYPASVAQSLIRRERADLTCEVMQLLSDPVFQEALYIAAPMLHEKALKWRDGDRSLEDIDLAVARYALRMAHRSTPFGAFSSVSALTVAQGRSTLRAPEATSVRKLVSIDYSVLAELAERIVDGDVGNAVRYQPNDTITIYPTYISYLRLRKRGGARAHYVEQLERSDILDFVLDVTGSGQGLTADDVESRLCEKYSSEYTREDIRGFIQDLKSQDVLVADSLLDPTAPDQLSALIGRLATFPPELEPTRELTSELRALAGNPLGAGLQELKRINDVVSTLCLRSHRSFHVVAFSPHPSGSVSDACMGEVERAIEALAEFSPRNNRLRRFKEMFSEQFGDASVPLSDLLPLLDAMGYPEEVRVAAPLADHISAAKKPKHRETASTISGPEAFALSVLATSGASEFIDISDYRRSGDSPALGPGRASCLVAWLALWNSGEGKATVELKSLGSQEPGRLMGRFSGALPEVLAYLDEAETSTPGKVYAQIVAVPMPRVGTVLSRPATLSPELRLRAGGGRDDITISDLDVFIARGRVVLWSNSRQAEVVLRMNSAHAYEKCKGAALYVFLNNVANQDHSCRMPSLRSRLPDAPYLPGLSYRGMIIERPSWRLTSEALGLSKCSDDQAMDRVRGWAREVRLPEFVEHGKDAPILLSLCSDWTARDFIKHLKKNGALTVADAFPMRMQPLLRGESGPRMHEIQIALRNGLSSRGAVEKRPQFDAGQGGDWAYICAYCKAADQNFVIRALYRVAKLAIGRQPKFFFVRYMDQDGGHVRLRFGAETRDERLAIIRKVEDESIKLERAGVLRKFAFKPYVQEVDRYQGKALMDLAEKIFVLDSSAIVRTFGKIPVGLNEFWRSAAMAADAMLKAVGIISLVDRLSFATTAAADFQREMDFIPEQRRLIGDVFKNSAPILLESGECDPSIPCFSDLADLDEIRSLLSTSKEFGGLSEQRAYSYRWSLLHMRFNRLFPRDARLQEAVCWELLKRSYLRHKAKAEAGIV